MAPGISAISDLIDTTACPIPADDNHLPGVRPCAPAGVPVGDGVRNQAPILPKRHCIWQWPSAALSPLVDTRLRTRPQKALAPSVCHMGADWGWLPRIDHR